MALFHFLNKEKNVKCDLFSIPYDYDGYDFMFKDHQTDSEIYMEITKLLTNNQYDITTFEEYQSFKENMNADTFIAFYDQCVNELRKNKYIILLDDQMNMN